MDKLLRGFLEHIGPPTGSPLSEESKANEPFSLAATMVGFDQFLGRTVTGKVRRCCASSSICCHHHHQNLIHESCMSIFTRS